MGLCEKTLFLFILRLRQAGRLTFFQQLERLSKHACEDFCFLVTAGCTLLCSRYAFFQAFHISQQQFGFHYLGIRNRIDGVGDVLDIVILETAKHMDNRVHLADIAEELVAQAFAAAGSFDEACNIGEAKLGINRLCTASDGCDLLQTLVRYRDLPDIGLDRAERIVRGLRGLRFGKGVE